MISVLLAITIFTIVTIGINMLIKHKKYIPKEIDGLSDLRRIIESKNSMVDPMKQNYSGELWLKNRIYFESLSKSFIKKVPLETIEFIREDEYGYYRWEACLSEYDKVYSSRFYEFIEEDLKPVYEIISKDRDNHMYHYILNRYELTFPTIITAIEESKSHIGHITEEVEGKLIHILEKFISEVKGIEKEEKAKEGALREATSKSVSEMLDFEIEFLDR